jgi:hypothetical protein
MNNKKSAAQSITKIKKGTFALLLTSMLAISGNATASEEQTVSKYFNSFVVHILSPDSERCIHYPRCKFGI